MTPDDIAAILLPLEVCFGVLPAAEKAEYAMAILKAGIDEAHLRKAVIYLRENHNPRHDGHKIPYASEIIAACRMPAKADPAKLENHRYCDVCDDQGWIVMEGVWREETETYGPTLVRICSHCDVGAAILRGSQAVEEKYKIKCPRTGTAQDKAENRRDYEEGEEARREWQKRKRLLAEAQLEQGDKVLDIGPAKAYTEDVPEDDTSIPF